MKSKHLSPRWHLTPGDGQWEDETPLFSLENQKGGYYQKSRRMWGNNGHVYKLVAHQVPAQTCNRLKSDGFSTCSVEVTQAWHPGYTWLQTPHPGLIWLISSKAVDSDEPQKRPGSHSRYSQSSNHQSGVSMHPEETPAYIRLQFQSFHTPQGSSFQHATGETSASNDSALALLPRP